MGRDEAKAPPQASGRQLAAIVAHRDGDMRAALCMLLEHAGYEVRIAADPDVGLEVARAHAEPAVVLFEIEPTRQAGGGFLELALLRAASPNADPRPPRLAFVALTTWPERLPRPLMRLLRRLDVPLVAEPFELDDLLHVIATAAGRCGDEEAGPPEITVPAAADVAPGHGTGSPVT